MISVYKLALASTLSFAALAASAADFYAGGSLGLSRYKNASDFEDSGVTIRVDDKTDTGYKLFGGAEVMPNFAVEAGYADLGKLKATGIAFGVSVPVTVKAHGYFVDAVGLLPVSQGVTLFAKLGVLSGKTKVSASAAGFSASQSETDTNLKLGFGANYELSKSVLIRAEWERYRFGSGSDKSDADLVTVGASFKF